MKKANIGISIAVEPNTTIWDSGLNQNLAFLVQLLSRHPAVGKLFLINEGSAQALPPGIGLDTPMVKAQDVTYDVDLVIEMGASLPLEWLRHVRALGTKIATFYVGHTYAGQAEGPIFGRTGGSAFIGTPWHEIWTLPHHMKTSGPLLRTVGRVPVFEVPHIWSPQFVDSQAADLTRAGLHFGFRPPAPGTPTPAWRVGIFEPNISVVKNCFIPMLVCESAYRQDAESIGLMMVMNTFHMKEHRTFNTFAVHLDLTRDHKASYEPRLAFAHCMAEHRMDAVVAHQWECGLNYAYYDALHGGYPLIHNSEYLQAAGMGFYYPGFEAVRGGAALLDARGRDPGYWEGYRQRAATYLERLAPAHPDNVSAFGDRITNLLGAQFEQA